MFNTIVSNRLCRYRVGSRTRKKTDFLIQFVKLRARGESIYAFGEKKKKTFYVLNRKSIIVHMVYIIY